MSDNGNDGTLVRDKLWFDGGFTMVPNSWGRDKKLTFQARGLLLELASHDAGFQITVVGLASGTIHGLDGIRSMVLELEHAGYLKRYRRRHKGRIVGTTWHLIDPHKPAGVDGQLSLDLEPVALKQPKKARSEPQRSQPDVAQPDVAQPALANPTTKEDHLKEEPINSSRDLTTDTRPEDEDAAGGSLRPATASTACDRDGHELIPGTRYCVLGCLIPDDALAASEPIGVSA